MLSLDDVTLNEQIPKEELSDLEKENLGMMDKEQKSGFDFSFLMTETGPGSIEDYIDHPMNFNSSLSVARILRGITGFTGSLRLAILDIVLGVLDFAREKPKVSI